MEKNEITIFVSTPTAFRNFFGHGVDRSVGSSLRLIRLASEALFKSDFESYKNHFSSDCILVYSYGSNETTSICDHFIDKNTEITGRRVPVGYVREGYEVALVDESGNNVASHEAGEIVVKSRFLSSGYWQQDRLVQEKFLAAGTETAERSYFTNDIGQWSETGCLEILGRKDSMVKVRGFRVDTGDVEATLADHPQISFAAVVAKEDAHGNTHLVAYYVPKGEFAPTVTNLRNFLKEKLSEFMIPSSFVKLDRAAIGPTGKLDRRTLPDALKPRPELDTRYVTATTPIEERLADLWAEALSLEHVGIHDNFFDLGGHSLLAARILSKINEAFRVEISMRTLLDAPTVAGLADVITALPGPQAIRDLSVEDSATEETGEI